MVNPPPRLSRINFRPPAPSTSVQLEWEIPAKMRRVIDTFLCRNVTVIGFRNGSSSSGISQQKSARIRSSVRSSKMEQTLRQLGELLLGAVPTVILLATLYILYTFIVHRPLTAVLAERRSRTQGAMEKARADIAAAEARTAEYEQRLREARQKIFKNQEARRQQDTQSRTQA
jgi:hypothetical protein